MDTSVRSTRDHALRLLGAAALAVLSTAPMACGVAANRRTGPTASPGVPVAVVASDRPASPRPNAPVSPVGCADGQREGFIDQAAYPDIAGCSGGWTTRGIMAGHSTVAPACDRLPNVADSMLPTCGLGGGDDGNSPRGEGCTVADLCAAGWQVCATADDITRRSSQGCAGATRPGDPPLFFATRQSSTGCQRCALGRRSGRACAFAGSCEEGCIQLPTVSNDVFGCGNFGAVSGQCGPLDRFSDNLCAGLAGSPWSCDAPATDDDNGLCEAYTVVKPSPSHGGVLCCRDAP